MTPPTFWRRISQRTVGGDGGGGDGSANNGNLEGNGHAEDGNDSRDTVHSATALSHRSSNATIRVSDVRRRGDVDDVSGDESDGPPPSPTWLHRHRSLFMIVLNLSILGAQLAWCLELSYGTPYLLGLGLSPQATSLVWLAGPISGLVAQPIIGSASDASTSSAWRRRYYMVFSTVFIISSTTTLAFAQPIAESIVDFLQMGLGDWDPVRQAHVKRATQFLAIFSFWILDFALNGLQGAGRALVLDTLQTKEMDYGNAWLGRMIHLGNIMGYGAGYVDLSHVRTLRWLGGDQFRKFAFVSLVGLVVSVGITCAFVEEHSEGRENHGDDDGDDGEVAKSRRRKGPGMWTVLKRTVTDVGTALKHLPRPIRRVCMVQLVAWMGWFPFLFYATTWIGTFEKAGGGVHERERRERRGNEGMLLFAVISLVFGTLLPVFSLGDRTPNDGDNASRNGSGNFVAAAVARHATVTSRTWWTASCALFAALMTIGVMAVQTPTQAVWLVGLVGIPWSINGWVPLSLVMAFVKEAESGLSPHEFEGDYYAHERVAERRAARRSSASGGGQDAARDALVDCQPLRSGGGGKANGIGVPSNNIAAATRIGSGSYISRGADVVRETGSGGGQNPTVADHHNGGEHYGAGRSHSGITLPRDYDDDDGGDEDDGLLPHHGHGDAPPPPDEPPTRGGTILGIHNLSIVLPQLFVSLVAAAIFARFNSGDSGGEDDGAAPREGTAPGTEWVLFFGGVAALFAAALTRLVPLTRRERLVREEQEEGRVRL